MASRASLVDLADVPAARQSVAKPRRSVFQRTPPWARAIGIALASVYAAYLLVANVILRTHLLRGWLSADANSLLLDYGSARSLFPGRVVVHDLRLRHGDRAVQMSVHIDRVSLDIDLLSLAQHTALMRHVKAEGVEYRLRQRLDSLEGSEGRARAFPIIEGFPASPLAALQPPLKEGKPHPWTIEISELEATVREVWTMEYHFRGAALLTGGFHIEPKQIVQVFPSTMHASDGTLLLGEEELVTGGDWTLDAAVDPFAPDQAKGASVLRFMSFAVHQHGGVVTIKPIGHTYLPSDLALDDGSGPIGIDVRVDHGIVQAGSRFTYAADRATFRGGALAISSDLDVVAEVDASESPHIVATARSKHGTLTPATDLSDLHAELTLHSLDATAPIVIDRLSGALGAARTADLRTWNAIHQLHDTHISFTGGAATVSARGDYEGGALTGHVDTKMDRVGLATPGPFSVVCSGTSSTDVKSADVADAITFPGAKVDVHDVSMKLLNSEASGLWMSARSNDTRIATSGKTMTDSHIALVSGPGEPTTKLFTGLAHLPDVAAEITAGAQLEAQVRLRVRHDDVAVDIDHAKDGALEGAGRLHHHAEKKASGAFLVKAGRLSAGIDIAPGGVAIVPLANDEWLKETAAKR